MATITIPIDISSCIPAATNGCAFKTVSGTNFPVRSLAFDASTDETCYFDFLAVGYGSGNVTLTVEWYSDSATSGDVIYGCAIAVITPNTDSQDIETDSFATAQTATDSHLGTTGQRLHSVAITISNLDSLAAGDRVFVQFYRDADAGGDTMTGDALVTALTISYSDS